MSSRRTRPQRRGFVRGRKRRTIPWISFGIAAILGIIFLGQSLVADPSCQANNSPGACLSVALTESYGEFALVAFSFLHQTVGHLLGNVVTLVFFGIQVEAEFSRYRYLVGVLGVAILTTALQIAYNLSTGGPATAIGISGAVYALAAYVAITQVNRPHSSSHRHPLTTDKLGDFYREAVLLYGVVLVVYAAGSAIGIFALGPETGIVAHISGTLIGVIIAMLFRSTSQR